MRNRFDLHLGDCLEVMPTLAADSVDSIVSDPPYGLSFMGKGWDHGVPGQSFWAEALRVAKPGAHLLAFGGTRTYHRLACSIEDAGWEIRDCVMWVYGSGFPKSHDVSKAIDKAAGAERERGPMKRGGERLVSLVDGKRNGNGTWGDESGRDPYTSLPATDAARQWSGWGTALKPAWEPIIVARKPLVGTVAENVLTHGTGGINVDGCRVGTNGEKPSGSGDRRGGAIYAQDEWTRTRMANGGNVTHDAGRWPANLIHDGSEEVVGLFPQTSSGNVKPYAKATRQGNAYGRQPKTSTFQRDGDTGSAARFFYCSKASKADRDEGCDGLEIKQTVGGGGLTAAGGAYGSIKAPARNHHPTVKPTSLMRYLCRLVTPPGGVVLDPFMGSGSTGKGAMLEGFGFIGIEREAEYLEIARARIDAATKSDNALPLFQEELACV
jgi:site-specific DNA-methyltransferase (adenine-specific)